MFVNVDVTVNSIRGDAGGVEAALTRKLLYGNIPHTTRRVSHFSHGLTFAVDMAVVHTTEHILPLPAEVVAQIRSSATITSLSRVVLGLLRNSIDAGAHKVDIIVDFRRGCCTVEDDGLGIPPREFREEGGLGKMYNTSRYHKSNECHGRHGAFLSSLAALSLLSITSHHRQHRSHNTLTLHHGKVVARQIPASPYQHLTAYDHGTRVVTTNLFGSLPVRVKQRARIADENAGSGRSWKNLRREITGLLLASSHALGVIVQDEERTKKITIRGPQSSITQNTSVAEEQTVKIRRILVQAGYISPFSWKPWTPLSASTPALSIKGMISLEPAPTRQIQFLSIGVRPISIEDGNNILSEQINRIFSSSRFGMEDVVEDITDHERDRRLNDRRYKRDGSTNRQLKKARKGVDRWPMFSFRVDFAQGRQADDVLDNRNAIDLIMELLDVMLTRFLEENYHGPQQSLRRSMITLGDDGQESNPTGVENVMPDSTEGLFQDSFPLKSGSGNTTSLQRKPSQLRAATAKSPATVRRRNISNKPAKPSPISGGVKLPTFATRSGCSGSSFSEWSRIKTAKSGSLEQLHDYDTKKPETAPPPEITISSDALAKLTRPATAPANAQSATIAQERVWSEANDYGNDTITADGADEVVERLNPVTRMKVLVNTRTGFIDPAKHSRPPSARSLRENAVLPNHIRRVSTDHRPATAASISSEPGPWLGGVLKDWTNPVFRPTEPLIPKVSLDSLEGTNIDKTIKQSTTGLPGKLSKEGIRNAKVIAQVDKKFILIKMLVAPRVATKPESNDARDVLVLIDQHAADERCRIEALFAELCASPDEQTAMRSNLGLISSLKTVPLDKPLAFELPNTEFALFRKEASHFADWGVLYDIVATASEEEPDHAETLRVISLPPPIAERCQSEPKLLIELLRAEVWKRQDESIRSRTLSIRHRPREDISRSHNDNLPLSDALPRSTGEAANDIPAWTAKIHACPSGILDLLNSSACRSAIMFNDPLTNVQYEALVRKLAGCVLPFQCAHGRPSMIPIVDLSSVSASDRLDDEDCHGHRGGWRD